MKVKHLLIPRGNGLHLPIGLVAHAVIDKLQLWLWQQLVEWFGQIVFFETWEEWALVRSSLDESVGCVAISFDRCHEDGSILIRELPWLPNRDCSSINCLLVDSSCIVNGECDILNSIAMNCILLIKFFMS